MYTHASIVPLIGGETLAQNFVLKNLPRAIYSYSVFKDNDQHLINYYKENGVDTEYYVLDEDDNIVIRKSDIVNTVCPCAGLSSLSTKSSANSKVNDWMFHTAEFVLSKLQPRVFWGENAPRLATKSGEPVVHKLIEIGKQYGYSFSIYKTKSLIHGLPQVRNRSFYFFWKGDKIPVLPYYNRKHKRLEDLIEKIGLRFEDGDEEAQQVPIIKNKATDDPYYRFVIEEMLEEKSHNGFFNAITKSSSPMDFIEANKVSYLEVAKWMKSEGYNRIAIRCKTIHEKLAAGRNIMRRITCVPKDYMGAFIGHLSTLLTHPYKDRYITVREALSIMGMPHDFKLLNPKKNINHVCQNVPVTTAMDMTRGIVMALDGKCDMISANYLIQDNLKQINTEK